MDLFHLVQHKAPSWVRGSNSGAPAAEAVPVWVKGEAGDSWTAKEVPWAGLTAAAIWTVQRGIGVADG